MTKILADVLSFSSFVIRHSSLVYATFHVYTAQVAAGPDRPDGRLGTLPDPGSRGPPAARVASLLPGRRRARRPKAGGDLPGLSIQRAGPLRRRHPLFQA